MYTFIQLFACCTYGFCCYVELVVQSLFKSIYCQICYDYCHFRTILIFFFLNYMFYTLLSITFTFTFSYFLILKQCEIKALE